MPWRIPSARCPRCERDVRAADLTAVAALWVRVDEYTATLWPRGQAAIPAGVQACTDCRDELRGLYNDQHRWEREARAYARN